MVSWVSLVDRTTIYSRGSLSIRIQFKMANQPTNFSIEAILEHRGPDKSEKPDRRHSLESEVSSDLSWDDVSEDFEVERIRKRLCFDTSSHAHHLRYNNTMFGRSQNSAEDSYLPLYSALSPVQQREGYRVQPREMNMAQTREEEEVSSSTVDLSPVTPETRTSPATNRTSPASSRTSPASQFPDWTQKQLRGGGRRPYSRSVVASLSWWYKHLPYLSTAEMETMGTMTGLTRHQIKIWWQNKRHSQRARAADTVGQLTSSLPCLPVHEVPSPHSPQRSRLFGYLLQFYYAHVLPRISFSHSVAFINL